MVYNHRSTETDMMPQMVPSAGYTPPFDYSATFAADSFDLSLLPGGETELPLSPSTLLYTQSPPPSDKPKIYTTYYPNSPEESVKVSNEIELGPDFQKLLVPSEKERKSPIHLEVPNNSYYPSSPSSYCSSTDVYQRSLISPTYPSSPCENFNIYPNSPLNNSEENLSYYQSNTNNNFTNSDLYINTDINFNQFVKKEETVNFTNSSDENNGPIYTSFQIKEESYPSPCSQLNSPISNCTNYSNHSSPVDPKLCLKDNSIPILEEAFLETNFLDSNKQIKQESTVDFGEILQNLTNLKEILNGNEFKKPEEQQKEEKPKTQDHKLLRQVLKDTSFQKKFNLKPLDIELGTFVSSSIKMEEPDMQTVEEIPNEELASETIDPVLSLAIEQKRKDINNTCEFLRISQYPFQWSRDSVKAWIQWIAQQCGIPNVQAELFDMPGSELTTLTEEDFTQRVPQGGAMLYAHLEIWKAAVEEEDTSMQWTTSCSSNKSSASSGDISDDDEEESPSTQTSGNKTSGSRTTGSHIHLWQFLKELLASPQVHGSCIRWLDRGKGVFKIEDSVRVAKLWGKRKNRPAMNYDKLSRSIRQYYKKGIMKKTERSQRLVYQFCHPYSL